MSFLLENCGKCNHCNLESAVGLQKTLIYSARLSCYSLIHAIFAQYDFKLSTDLENRLLEILSFDSADKSSKDKQISEIFTNYIAEVERFNNTRSLPQKDLLLTCFNGINQRNSLNFTYQVSTQNHFLANRDDDDSEPILFIIGVFFYNLNLAETSQKAVSFSSKCTEVMLQKNTLIYLSSINIDSLKQELHSILQNKINGSEKEQLIKTTLLYNNIYTVLEKAFETQRDLLSLITTIANHNLLLDNHQSFFANNAKILGDIIDSHKNNDKDINEFDTSGFFNKNSLETIKDIASETHSYENFLTSIVFLTTEYKKNLEIQKNLFPFLYGCSDKALDIVYSKTHSHQEFFNTLHQQIKVFEEHELNKPENLVKIVELRRRCPELKNYRIQISNSLINLNNLEVCVRKLLFFIRLKHNTLKETVKFFQLNFKIEKIEKQREEWFKKRVASFGEFLHSKPGEIDAPPPSSEGTASQASSSSTQVANQVEEPSIDDLMTTLPQLLVQPHPLNALHSTIYQSAYQNAFMHRDHLVTLFQRFTTLSKKGKIAPLYFTSLVCTAGSLAIEQLLTTILIKSHQIESSKDLKDLVSHSLLKLLEIIEEKQQLNLNICDNTTLYNLNYGEINVRSFGSHKFSLNREGMSLSNQLILLAVLIEFDNPQTNKDEFCSVLLDYFTQTLTLFEKLHHALEKKTKREEIVAKHLNKTSEKITEACPFTELTLYQSPLTNQKIKLIYDRLDPLTNCSSIEHVIYEIIRIDLQILHQDYAFDCEHQPNPELHYQTVLRLTYWITEKFLRAASKSPHSNLTDHNLEEISKEIGVYPMLDEKERQFLSESNQIRNMARYGGNGNHQIAKDLKATKYGGSSSSGVTPGFKRAMTSSQKRNEKKAEQAALTLDDMLDTLALIIEKTATKLSSGPSSASKK